MGVNLDETYEYLLVIGVPRVTNYCTRVITRRVHGGIVNVSRRRLDARLFRASLNKETVNLNVNDGDQRRADPTR